MLTAIATFASALAVSAGLTPVIRGVAHRLGLLDHALTSRKIHGRPIPRLGGVAIVTGFFAPLGLLFTSTEAGGLFAARHGHVVGLLTGGALIAALGVWDDLRGTGAKTKFLVQFGVGGLLWASGYRIEALSLPLAGVIHLGWLGLPLTLLWIAGIVNALNLIDGLDGLAGGVALIAGATVLVLALGSGDQLVALFAAALTGAALGFLFFNFNPASIFMGDTGSMFLGFVLAATSILASQATSSAVALHVPVVLLGLPIADTLLAMGRRALRGVPMFAADRGHIHHRLLARGLSHKQTVLALYGLVTCLAGTALVVARGSEPVALLALGLLVAASAVVLRALGFFDWSRIDELLEQRRRNREMRLGIGRVAGRLRSAATPAALWESVKGAAPALGAHHVALHLAANGEPFAHDGGLDGLVPANGPLLRARFSVAPARPGASVLELGWADGRGAVDRDTEIAVEQLCAHIATALDRIDGGFGAVLEPPRRGARILAFRRSDPVE